MSTSGDQDAKCHVLDCAYKDDCEIIRITGRRPQQGKRCSYYENEKSSNRRKKLVRTEKDEKEYQQ